MKIKTALNIIDAMNKTIFGLFIFTIVFLIATFNNIDFLNILLILLVVRTILLLCSTKVFQYLITHVNSKAIFIEVAYVAELINFDLFWDAQSTYEKEELTPLKDFLIENKLKTSYKEYFRSSTYILFNPSEIIIDERRIAWEKIKHWEFSNRPLGINITYTGSLSNTDYHASIYLSSIRGASSYDILILLNRFCKEYGNYSNDNF